MTRENKRRGVNDKCRSTRNNGSARYAPKFDGKPLFRDMWFILRSFKLVLFKLINKKIVFQKIPPWCKNNWQLVRPTNPRHLTSRFLRFNFKVVYLQIPKNWCFSAGNDWFRPPRCWLAVLFSLGHSTISASALRLWDSSFLFHWGCPFSVLRAATQLVSNLLINVPFSHPAFPS